jgi:phosphate acetyltransferase
MALRSSEFGHDGAMIYADCGVVIEPSAVELAEIAIAAADSCKALLGAEPACRAALVFHERKCETPAGRQSRRRQRGTVKARAPELLIDGELQADRGADSRSRAIKSAGFAGRGRANVLIFPDLQSGNIAYKLTERLAGATAIGPILQGLDKPANDLSRGCTARDIVDAIAITAVQAQARKALNSAAGQRQDFWRHPTADSSNVLAETHNWSSGHGGAFGVCRHAELQSGTSQTTSLAFANSRRQISQSFH